MKVAVVYHFFAHYREPIIRELMSDTDIDYYFIGSKSSNSLQSSLKLYEFRQNDRFIAVENVWIKKYFLWQRGLTSVLQEQKFDAVIFLGDWKFMSTWGAIRFLKRKRIPTFFWGHGLLNNKFGINNFLKLFFLNQFSNGGFLYSHGAKEIMLKRGYRKPLHVIYNSLDFENQQRVLSSVNMGEDINLVDLPRPYVIFSGRLILQRKLELLIDAVEILSDKGINLNVLVIGDGPHKSILLDYAKHKDVLSSIIFKGAVYDEHELAKYFKNALACIYPGPIGLAIIHSFSYGVPVITNDDFNHQKPEIEALNPGVNGFLFRNNDVFSLVDKIEEIFNLSQQKRDEMRIEAIKVISEKYNPRVQAAILRRAMMECL